MAQYIRLSDLQYPFFEGDLRNVHPEITEDQTGPSFPVVDDFAAVAWVDPPTTNPPLEQAVEGSPEQVDGQWRMTWVVKTYTQAEWDAMQPKRHPDLSASGESPDVVA
jgi:hypothetical protein